MERIVYDLEIYPNVFTFAGVDADSDACWQFEISSFRNESTELYQLLTWLELTGATMIGFNNVGFDYPILHLFMQMGGKCGPGPLYEKCNSIIMAQNQGEKFSHVVYPNNRRVRQIDLFRIHHFDNKAKMTSLKAIEFNMKFDSVEDLPFPPGMVLDASQIDTLKKYNLHDVLATKAFYRESKAAIEFREALKEKYGKSFTNHNDVAIGKAIFQMELEKRGVSLYTFGSGGRKPAQTLRPVIRLRDCIPEWIRFHEPPFLGICQRMMAKSIYETKGAMDDMTCEVFGLEFVFGTGGLHASIENKACKADEHYDIIDADVTSMYPSIAIENCYYPEHLGEAFVSIYRDLKAQRMTYKKGSPENNALKLALNGTFGASNDKYSVFYDPLFTMRITIGGQMMLAMLADTLGQIDGLRIIQCNTDGITCMVPKIHRPEYNARCIEWEKKTKLALEYAEFTRMFIADVNNYIAVDTKGKVKRKGKYDYNVSWHQNASRLVVPKVAEQVLIYDKPLQQTVREWPDPYDFMCRVKVPRTSRLIIRVPGTRDQSLPNMTRYYAAKKGGMLIKIMPPLPKKPGVYREIGVEAKQLICPCNKIGDAKLEVDHDYYIEQVEKLTNKLKDFRP